MTWMNFSPESAKDNPMKDKRQVVARIVEWAVIALVPCVLLLCALFEVEQAAILTMFTAIFASIPFFLHFERARPKPRDIMPIVVMAALATTGQILFAPIPSFKPIGAIVIVTAIAFGRQSGYMTGAMTAVASNMFFGQGAWTPWQMFGWGLIGYLAGALSEHGFFGSRWTVYVYGFLSGLLYGVILDSWHIIGFVQPLTWQNALAAYGAGLPMNLTLSVATVLFLAPILGPWTKKLERIKRKFGLSGSDESIQTH